MSARQYDICLLVGCLSTRTWTMFVYLCYVYLPVLYLLKCVTSAYLLDVWLPYDFCLPILCLATCTMTSGYPYDSMSCFFYVSLLVRCMDAVRYDVLLPSCFCSCMFGNLYDVCLPVWWMSASLYDGPVNVMSAYLYYVFLQVWCLLNCICQPTCIMSAQWCDVCSPVRSLFNHMMSADL